MSNRVKARLTVMVGLLVIVAWRLLVQQAALAARVPFPPLLPQQVVSAEAAPIADCPAAVVRVHAQPLTLASPAQREAVVLAPERAVLLVRSVATAYLQRDYQTPARVGPPVLVTGVFLGVERLAWGQVWQPPGFDGTFSETEALVVYVDAVAAVPLMIYTDVAVTADVTGCVLPPPPRTPADQLNDWLPVVIGVAVMLIALGALLDLRARSVVAVSR